MSCCPENESSPKKAPEKKKMNYLFELNQTEDFRFRSRVLQRVVQTEGGDLFSVKVRYKGDALRAIFVESDSMRDMQGNVIRGRRSSGWIVETPLGGSMFFSEEQFSHLFEIVEEDDENNYK